MGRPSPIVSALMSQRSPISLAAKKTGPVDDCQEWVAVPQFHPKRFSTSAVASGSLNPVVLAESGGMQISTATAAFDLSRTLVSYEAR